MKQKANSLPVIRLVAAVLMFCAVFAIMPDTGSDVYAASSKVKFASSIKKSVLKKAKKAGAGKKTKIAVAKVSNYTNIYKKASVYSKEVGRLYKGTGAYVIKKGKTLSYISSGSVKGWVKNKCLMTGSAAKKYMKKEAPKVATLKKYKKLSVRVKPTAASTEISYMKKGESLVVAKVMGDWLQVRLVNFSMKLPKANSYKYGYIYKKYVKVESGLCKGVSVTEENERKKRINTSAAKKDPAEEAHILPEEGTEETTTSPETTEASEGNTKTVTYKYVPAEEVDDIENSATYKRVQSQCKWKGTVLNRINGRIQGPSGEETYYTDKGIEGKVAVLKRLGRIADTDKEWIRSDGVRMIGNYVAVAADVTRSSIGHIGLRPLGTVYETSLGMGIVCDTGGFALKNPTATDIWTTWK